MKYHDLFKMGRIWYFEQSSLVYIRLDKNFTFFTSMIVFILGFPQPDVQWLQDKKPVSKSCRVTMEHHEDGLCSLVLADLEPSDSGVYMCRASNKLGEAVCSAKLKVEM